MYAGSFRGIDILCDLEVADYRPSEFSTRYVDAALDFGNEALRALLGFIIEGRIQATDLDPEAVTPIGFNVPPAGGKWIRADPETT